MDSVATGDKVRCIDNEGCEQTLTLGKVYEVRHTLQSKTPYALMLGLLGEGGPNNFYARRFEKVEP